MSLEGDVCPADCAAGPAGWSLALLCPLPDGEMVVPAFSWSLEFEQHRQELGFIKGLLEMQINTVMNVVAISCVSSSNSRRMSPSSSLPEGGRENCLKTRVCVTQPPGPLAPAAGPCLGQCSQGRKTDFSISSRSRSDPEIINIQGSFPIDFVGLWCNLLAGNMGGGRAAGTQGVRAKETSPTAHKEL